MTESFGPPKPPKLRTLIAEYDTLDATRLGYLVLACADFSQDRYVLLRYSHADKLWKVNVRWGHRHKCPCGDCPGMREHVATAQDSPMSALDRACQWLRAAHARELAKAEDWKRRGLPLPPRSPEEL